MKWIRRRGSAPEQDLGSVPTPQLPHFVPVTAQATEHAPESDLSTWAEDDVADPIVPDTIAPETPRVEPFNELGEAVFDYSETIPLATPRKGRNMWAASSVGMLLLVVTLAAAWYDPRLLGILLYSFLFAGVFEWRNALRKQGQRLSLVPIGVATYGMGIATWYGAERGPGAAEGLVVAMLVGCAGLVAWRVVDERIENTFAEAVGSIFALMWIPFLGSFVMLLEMSDNGWQRVVILIVAVAGNDTGGLFSGMAFGKHKLAPRVSPKKTWEGAMGGVALAIVSAGVASYFLFDGQWWIGVAVGLAAAVASIIGDLAESALKRDMDVKDMSGFIPGHGGILDRIDSLLVAGPAVYVVFAILF
ncbi:phosphatidate cytidylyltransferase [Demequina aurantiaca]|uniref:phosphatidate cytidylyltransferase n=1 Tax=Demequina aurantiaca TaxID=676200 RepID=UPI003D334938